METVRPNYITLVFRIILLCFFIYLVGIIFRNHFLGKYDHEPRIVYLGLIVFSLFLIYLIWSLFGVFEIKYSEFERSITFKYLLGGEKLVLTSDITGYYQTTLKTRFKNYGGYIFKLSNGKTVEVTEYNLGRLRNFYSFIVKAGVPCIGAKESWYPLKRKV
jgi:hypothetical protein